MPFSFLSHIEPQSISINRELKPKIIEIPELISDWKSYLHSIEAPERLIEKLNTHDPRFILSGQQIGFLCSPILSLYKALTAELLAKVVNTKYSIDTIPVFWLQTEDHDLEEISKATIINQAQELLNLGLSTIKDNRTPVGDLLTADLIGALEPDIDSLPEDVKLKILASLKKETLGVSYAYLFYKLFPETDILLFDPRLLNLTKYTSAVYTQCIDKAEDIHALLRDQVKLLKENNQPVPISVVKNRSLFFLATEGSNRFRLEFTSSTFTYNGSTFTKEELQDILKNDPKRFTSSALLRPILQDYLFSSLAYVGGKSELQYHKQTTSLYKYFNLIQPQLVERAQGTIIDQKTFKWLPDIHDTKLFLSDLKTFQDEIISCRSLSINVKNIKVHANQKLADLVEFLTSTSRNLDQSLSKPLSKTTNTLNEAVNKYITKVEEQELREDSYFNERIDRIIAITHPQNILQERLISAISVITLLGTEGYEIVKKSFSENIKQQIVI